MSEPFDYDKPNWVNVPDGEAPPSGAPALDADALDDIGTAIDALEVRTTALEDAEPGTTVDAVGLSQVRALLPSHTLAWRTLETPPTVTDGESVVSDITGDWEPSINPVTSGLVGLWGAGGFAHPPGGYPATMVYRPASRAPDVNGNTSGAYRIAFYTDAPVLEVMLLMGTGGDTAYRIKIDDEFIDTTPVIPDIAANSFDRIKLDFTGAGGSRVRKIVVETVMDIAGIDIPATATIWPAAPRGPRFAVFGDSYTNGSNGVSAAWPDRLAELLGWEDVWSCAIGSTGYLATIGGHANTAADQIAALAADPDWAPDVVFGGWGHNDVASNAAIAAEAADAWTAARTAWPNAVLICGGPMWVGGAGEAAYWQAREALLFPAVADIVDHTIPQATGAGTPWFTGTGKVGATTGAGNSDGYVSTDGVHPTQAGHNYLGERFAGEFLARLGI